MRVWTMGAVRADNNRRIAVQGRGGRVRLLRVDMSERSRSEPVVLWRQKQAPEVVLESRPPKTTLCWIPRSPTPACGWGKEKYYGA